MEATLKANKKSGARLGRHAMAYGLAFFLAGLGIQVLEEGLLIVDGQLPREETMAMRTS